LVRKIAITIIADYELLSKLYESVKDDIYPPEAKKCAYSGRGALRLILDEHSDAHARIMQVCQQHQLHPYVAQAVYHTKKEVDASEYFSLFIPTPLELEGTDPSDYGTKYTGGCPYCGLGRTAIDDVLVDRKFVRKHHIGRLFPEIFVSEQIKTLLQENGISGVSFSQLLKDYKGRNMGEYFIMEISSILPPVSKTTWLLTSNYPNKTFKECGHQVVYLRSDLQYEREKLSGAQDFNLTCEYLNNYRMREIVVSAKVRNLFKEHRIRAHCAPITLLDPV